MSPLRILVIGFVAACIGGLLSFCARKRSATATSLWSAGAAILGVGAAAALEGFYPALFNNLFDSKSWFEWVELIPSPFALMLLPRSLVVMALGLFLGVTMVRPGPAKRAYLPIAAFATGFLLTWGLQAEHLPRGVETRTYAYRIYDMEDYQPSNMSAWQQHSDNWIAFLEWTLTPHTGYESFSYSTVKAMPDRFGGDVTKPESGDTTAYVFVKEYWKDGKQVGTIRTVRFGFLTTAEIQETFRNMVRARTTPGG